MPSPHPAAIAFLAPGLVHQFGNLLLTIQGHALQLDRPPAAGLGRAQQAILQASDRGGVSLRILRILLGEPGELQAPAAQLLEMFGELARVPVREAGHRLDLLGDSAAGYQITANEFFPNVTAAVLEVLAAVPHGVRGRLHIELAGARGCVDADIRFVTEAGNLPFPLQLGGRVAALAASLRDRGDRTVVRELGDGLRLVFASLPMATEACGDLHASLPDST